MLLPFDKPLRILSNLSTTFPVVKQAVPKRIRRALGDFFLNRAIVSYPDRVFMRDAVIPYVLKREVSRVLSVGVRQYTVEITEQLSENGVEVWTLDIDPEAQAWGSPGRHIVGDAMRLDEVQELHGFPCILFNGVLGYGIDDPDQIGRALTALSAIMPTNGLLVLGWNTDRIPDPIHHPEFGRFRYLKDENLPPRVSFPSSTHVYDFLEPAFEL